MSINFPPPVRYFFNEILPWLALLATFVFMWATCRPDQSWGGDYAGYLYEAKTIAHGKNTAESLYLYNEKIPSLAPPSYPVGFPMLLAGLMKIFGETDTLPFVRFVTICWCLLGVATFLLLRRYFGNWSACLSVVCFLLNPQFIMEKNGILPDGTCVAATFAAVFWYQFREKTLRNALIVGIFGGLAWLCRANGVGFFLAVAAAAAWDFIQKSWQNRALNFKDPSLRYPLAVCATILLIQISTHKILFPQPPAGSYFDQLELSKFGWATFTHHFRLLFEVIYFKVFCLENGQPNWKNELAPDQAMMIAGGMIFTFMVIGFLSPRREKEGFLTLFLLINLMVLLVWPLVQVLRYVLIVMPILLYFILKGIDFVKFPSKTAQILKGLAIPILLVGAYQRVNLKAVEKLTPRDIWAPNQTVAQISYQYVRENLPPDAVVAHGQPLIMACYGDRKSFRWRRFGGADSLWQDVKTFGATHILLNSCLLDYDEDCKQMLEKYQTSLDTVWKNEWTWILKVK